LDGQQRTTALLSSIYGGRIKGQEDRDSRIYVDLTVPEAEEPEDQPWRTRFLFWDEIDDRGGELLRNSGRKKSYDRGFVVKLEDVVHQYQDIEERLVNSGCSFRDPSIHRAPGAPHAPPTPSSGLSYRAKTRAASVCARPFSMASTTRRRKSSWPSAVAL
jgi:hypothetical protein